MVNPENFTAETPKFSSPEEEIAFLRGYGLKIAPTFASIEL